MNPLKGSRRSVSKETLAAMVAAMVVARNKTQNNTSKNIPFQYAQLLPQLPYSLNYYPLAPLTPLTEDSDRRDYSAEDRGRVLTPIYLLGWIGAADASPESLPREQLGIHRLGLL